MNEHETFFTLLTDLAHWEFELFLMFIVDFVIGVLIWPRIRKAQIHHQSDDKDILELQIEVKRLSQIIENQLQRK
jgi:hypothetical protein